MFMRNKKGQVPQAKRDFTKMKTPHTYAIIFFRGGRLLDPDISDPGRKVQHP